MPETRITNRTFYSNAIPRVPVIDTSVPPEEVPNPTNPNVGQPTASETITAGTVPNITRVNHSQDIFVPLGTTMSISYQADNDCTLLPKGGYEDMVVSYSSDGRTMTLTWDAAIDEPADSTYIGCEVWVHGDTPTTEAYAVYWDRLHVGKTLSDLKYIGKSTSAPVIFPALRDGAYSPGDSVIITNGTYENTNDFIGIGYSGDAGFNSSFPSGVGEEITHEGESFYVPIKHTNIMAETPLGVLLNRNNDSKSVMVRGDARTGPNYSNRLTYAINVLGIDLYKGIFGFDLQRTDSCSVNYSASVLDTNRDETPRGFGDGANLVKRANRNANYEYVLSFGNQRLLNLDGNGEGRGVWRGVYGTSGATQISGEHITQTFTGYGAANQDWLNCWAIDGGLFAKGIRLPVAGNQPSPNAVFITTNASGHNYYGHGLLSLNTVRSPLYSDQPSPRNTFKSCVFWQKLNVTNFLNEPMDRRPMIARGLHDLEDITVGKNLAATYADTSGINCGHLDVTFTRLLGINPVWDRNVPDIFADPTNTTQFQDLYLIKPAPGVDPELPNTSGYAVSTLLPKDLGAHYISRIEHNSVLANLPGGRGCKDLFAAVGRYGKRYIDASREVYDGTNGRPRVNKMARGPWFEFRRARKRYLCTSNSLTFTGDIGVAKDGVHPVDYVNRFGTDPSTPENCPYLDDTYGVVDGADVKLFWRPVCAAYRSTITGFSIYIDDVLHLENIAPNATSVSISGVNPGTRRFEIVCIDPTHGNSGKSTPVILTI